MLYKNSNGYFLTNDISVPKTQRIWSRQLIDGLSFLSRREAEKYITKYLPEYELMGDAYKDWMHREGKVMVYGETIF